MSFVYEYPRPAMSADCILFGWRDQQIQLLLIQRRHPPFEGRWALPGGFMDIDETPAEAAHRELQEETGLRRIALQPLGTYGTVDRDPRTRVVTVAHWGLVRPAAMKQTQAGDDAAEARWHAIDHLPPLAFDHRTIVKDAMVKLQHQCQYHVTGREWLGRSFAISQIVGVYQAILQRKVAPVKLKRWLLKNGVIESAEGEGELFSFNSKIYKVAQSQVLGKSAF